MTAADWSFFPCSFGSGASPRTPPRCAVRSWAFKTSTTSSAARGRKNGEAMARPLRPLCVRSVPFPAAMSGAWVEPRPARGGLGVNTETTQSGRRGASPKVGRPAARGDERGWCLYALRSLSCWMRCSCALHLRVEASASFGRLAPPHLGRLCLAFALRLRLGLCTRHSWPRLRDRQPHPRKPKEECKNVVHSRSSLGSGD